MSIPERSCVKRFSTKQIATISPLFLNGETLFLALTTECEDQWSADNSDSCHSLNLAPRFAADSEGRLLEGCFHGWVGPLRGRTSRADLALTSRQRLSATHYCFAVTAGRTREKCYYMSDGLQPNHRLRNAERKVSGKFVDNSYCECVMVGLVSKEDRGTKKFATSRVNTSENIVQPRPGQRCQRWFFGVLWKTGLPHEWLSLPFGWTSIFLMH